MDRLTTNNPKNNMESALNLFFVKDGTTWIRGYGDAKGETNQTLYDLVREISVYYDLTIDPNISDDELSECISDELDYGVDTLEGVTALLYTAAWAFAELRENLAAYEDIGTVEEFKQLADADKEIKQNGKAGDTIYVGECIPFDVSVNADNVLEQLENDAFDFAGEAAEGWELYKNKCDSEMDELNQQLTKVVKKWLKKYNREPYFYAVENVRAVEV